MHHDAPFFSQVALLQALLGDDVDKAISGLGLVRALELVTSVDVPADVKRAILRHGAKDEDELQELDFESLKSAVTKYVRLVFVRLLTDRWAAPKQQRAGGKGAVGRFKFSVSGVTRGPGFDATTAVTSDPRLVQVIGSYAHALVERAFPSRRVQGEHVDVTRSSGAGPHHPPPHPHLVMPTVSATGGMTFGKDGAGRLGGAGAGLGTGPGNTHVQASTFVGVCHQVTGQSGRPAGMSCPQSQPLPRGSPWHTSWARQRGCCTGAGTHHAQKQQG